MLFPKDKIKICSSFQGHESQTGWIVLDIKNVDLDGVSQVAINLDEVERLKKRSGEEQDLLERMRNLLSEP